VQQRVCVLALVAVIGTASAVRAQSRPDEASLKLVHETMIKNVTAGNLAVIQGLIHPQAVGFFRDSQQAVRLGPSLTPAAILPTLIADLGHFSSTTPTDTGYLALGNVGIVNMTTYQERKSNERGPDRFVRGTYVYLWEGGSWKLVSWHGSDTPLKK
jgi:hypothetical protein